MVHDQEIWPASSWYHHDHFSDLGRLGLSGFSHLHQNAQDSRLPVLLESNLLIFMRNFFNNCLDDLIYQNV
jgi:hypothetical protein